MYLLTPSQLLSGKLSFLIYPNFGYGKRKKKLLERYVPQVIEEQRKTFLKIYSGSDPDP